MTSYNHVEARSVLRLPRVAAAWSIVVASLLLLAGSMTSALGQQPAESVEQGATPMDQIDLTNPQPGQPLVPVPVEPEKKSPFFDDAKISAQARTFYLYRDKYDDSISEAWALGGSVTFQSGYVANRFRVGAAAYTSQPLYAPDGRDASSARKGRLLPAAGFPCVRSRRRHQARRYGFGPAPCRGTRRDRCV